MSMRAAVAAVISACIAATAAIVVASRPDGRLHVTVLDVGSAPAILVHTDDGRTVLIDGGSSPTLLLGALGRVLAPLTARIDMIVLTGGEKAAVAGLAGLPGHYAVGTLVTPGDLTPGGNAAVAGLEQSGADVLDPAGAPWTFGGATWRCLGFVSQATARSMCALDVADPTGRLLILGDAGTADQEELCAVYGSALGADVVVTPPGGAMAGALLDTARPLALAVPLAKGSAAVSAPSGYPTDRTSADGDIDYTGGPQGLHPAG